MSSDSVLLSEDGGDGASSPSQSSRSSSSPPPSPSESHPHSPSLTQVEERLRLLPILSEQNQSLRSLWEREKSHRSRLSLSLHLSRLRLSSLLRASRITSLQTAALSLAVHLYDTTQDIEQTFQTGLMELLGEKAIQQSEQELGKKADVVEEESEEKKVHREKRGVWCVKHVDVVTDRDTLGPGVMKAVWESGEEVEQDSVRLLPVKHPEDERVLAVVALERGIVEDVEDAELEQEMEEQLEFLLERFARVLDERQVEATREETLVATEIALQHFTHNAALSKSINNCLLTCISSLHSTLNQESDGLEGNLLEIESVLEHVLEPSLNAMFTPTDGVELVSVRVEGGSGGGEKQKAKKLQKNWIQIHVSSFVCVTLEFSSPVDDRQKRGREVANEGNEGIIEDVKREMIERVVQYAWRVIYTEGERLKARNKQRETLAALEEKQAALVQAQDTLEKASSQCKLQMDLFVLLETMFNCQSEAEIHDLISNQAPALLSSSTVSLVKRQWSSGDSVLTEDLLHIVFRGQQKKHPVDLQTDRVNAEEDEFLLVKRVDIKENDLLTLLVAKRRSGEYSAEEHSIATCLTALVSAKLQDLSMISSLEGELEHVKQDLATMSHTLSSHQDHSSTTSTRVEGLKTFVESFQTELGWAAIHESHDRLAAVCERVERVVLEVLKSSTGVETSSPHFKVIVFLTEQHLDEWQSKVDKSRDNQRKAYLQVVSPPSMRGERIGCEVGIPGRVIATGKRSWTDVANLKQYDLFTKVDDPQAVTQMLVVPIRDRQMASELNVIGCIQVSTLVPFEKQLHSDTINLVEAVGYAVYPWLQSLARATLQQIYVDQSKMFLDSMKSCLPMLRSLVKYPTTETLDSFLDEDIPAINPFFRIELPSLESQTGSSPSSKAMVKVTNTLASNDSNSQTAAPLDVTAWDAQLFQTFFECLSTLLFGYRNLIIHSSSWIHGEQKLRHTKAYWASFKSVLASVQQEYLEPLETDEGYAEMEDNELTRLLESSVRAMFSHVVSFVKITSIAAVSSLTPAEDMHREALQTGKVVQHRDGEVVVPLFNGKPLPHASNNVRWLLFLKLDSVDGDSGDEESFTTLHDFELDAISTLCIALTTIHHLRRQLVSQRERFQRLATSMEHEQFRHEKLIETASVVSKTLLSLELSQITADAIRQAEDNVIMQLTSSIPHLQSCKVISVASGEPTTAATIGLDYFPISTSHALRIEFDPRDNSSQSFKPCETTLNSLRAAAQYLGVLHYCGDLVREKEAAKTQLTAVQKQIDNENKLWTNTFQRMREREMYLCRIGSGLLNLRDKHASFEQVGEREDTSREKEDGSLLEGLRLVAKEVFRMGSSLSAEGVDKLVLLAGWPVADLQPGHTAWLDPLQSDALSPGKHLSIVSDAEVRHNTVWTSGNPSKKMVLVEYLRQALELDKLSAVRFHRLDPHGIPGALLCVVQVSSTSDHPPPELEAMLVSSIESWLSVIGRLGSADRSLAQLSIHLREKSVQWERLDSENKQVSQALHLADQFIEQVKPLTQSLGVADFCCIISKVLGALSCTYFGESTGEELDNCLPLPRTSCLIRTSFEQKRAVRCGDTTRDKNCNAALDLSGCKEKTLPHSFVCLPTSAGVFVVYDPDQILLENDKALTISHGFVQWVGDSIQSRLQMSSELARHKTRASTLVKELETLKAENVDGEESAASLRSQLDAWNTTFQIVSDMLVHPDNDDSASSTNAGVNRFEEDLVSAFSSLENVAVKSTALVGASPPGSPKKNSRKRRMQVTTARMQDLETPHPLDVASLTSGKLAPNSLHSLFVCAHAIAQRMMDRLAIREASVFLWDRNAPLATSPGGVLQLTRVDAGAVTVPQTFQLHDPSKGVLRYMLGGASRKEASFWNEVSECPLYDQEVDNLDPDSSCLYYTPRSLNLKVVPVLFGWRPHQPFSNQECEEIEILLRGLCLVLASHSSKMELHDQISDLIQQRDGLATSEAQLRDKLYGLSNKMERLSNVQAGQRALFQLSSILCSGHGGGQLQISRAADHLLKDIVQASYPEVQQARLFVFVAEKGLVAWDSNSKSRTRNGCNVVEYVFSTGQPVRSSQRWTLPVMMSTEDKATTPIGVVDLSSKSHADVFRKDSPDKLLRTCVELFSTSLTFARRMESLQTEQSRSAVLEAELREEIRTLQTALQDKEHLVTDSKSLFYARGVELWTFVADLMGFVTSQFETCSQSSDNASSHEQQLLVYAQEKLRKLLNCNSVQLLSLEMALREPMTPSVDGSLVPIQPVNGPTVAFARVPQACIEQTSKEFVMTLLNVVGSVLRQFSTSLRLAECVRELKQKAKQVDEQLSEENQSRHSLQYELELARQCAHLWSALHSNPSLNDSDFDKLVKEKLQSWVCAALDDVAPRDVHVEVVRSFEDRYPKGRVDCGVAGFVARTAQVVCAGNVRADPRFHPDFDTRYIHKKPSKGLLCAPLVDHSQGEVVGIVQVFTALEFDAERHHQVDLTGRFREVCNALESAVVGLVHRQQESARIAEFEQKESAYQANVKATRMLETETERSSKMLGWYLALSRQFKAAWTGGEEALRPCVEMVSQACGELVGSKRAVLLFAGEKEWWGISPSQGRFTVDLGSQGQLLLNEQPLSPFARCVKEQKPQLIDGSYVLSRALGTEAYLDEIHSSLIMPVLVSIPSSSFASSSSQRESTVVAILHVVNKLDAKDGLCSFTQSDVQVLDTLCNHLGVLVDSFNAQHKLLINEKELRGKVEQLELEKLERQGQMESMKTQLRQAQGKVTIQKELLWNKVDEKQGAQETIESLRRKAAELAGEVESLRRSELSKVKLLKQAEAVNNSLTTEKNALQSALDRLKTRYKQVEQNAMEVLVSAKESRGEIKVREKQAERHWREKQLEMEERVLMEQRAMQRQFDAAEIKHQRERQQWEAEKHRTSMELQQLKNALKASQLEVTDLQRECQTLSERLSLKNRALNLGPQDTQEEGEVSLTLHKVSSTLPDDREQRQESNHEDIHVVERQETKTRKKESKKKKDKRKKEESRRHSCDLSMESSSGVYLAELKKVCDQMRVSQGRRTEAIKKLIHLETKQIAGEQGNHREGLAKEQTSQRVRTVPWNTISRAAASSVKKQERYIKTDI